MLCFSGDLTFSSSVCFRAADGKMVGATPDTEKALSEELAKLGKVFNATGDMTQFPSFSFTGEYGAF